MFTFCAKTLESLVKLFVIKPTNLFCFFSTRFNCVSTTKIFVHITFFGDN